MIHIHAAHILFIENYFAPNKSTTYEISEGCYKKKILGNVGMLIENAKP